MTIDDTTLLRSGRCLGETAREANAASPAHTTATRKSWKCDVSCGPKTSQDGTIRAHPRPPSLAALPSCHSASCSAAVIIRPMRLLQKTAFQTLFFGKITTVCTSFTIVVWL